MCRMGLIYPRLNKVFPNAGVNPVSNIIVPATMWGKSFMVTFEE